MDILTFFTDAYITYWNTGKCVLCERGACTQ